MRQAVGGSTRKQLADAALRGQILAMREQRAAAGPAAERRPAPGSSTPRPAAGAPAGPGAAGSRAPPGARAGVAGAAAARPPPPPRLSGAKRAAHADLEDDFDDEGDDGGPGDWRAMLRAVTGGYDPSRRACTHGQFKLQVILPI